MSTKAERLNRIQLKVGDVVYVNTALSGTRKATVKSMTDHTAMIEWVTDKYHNPRTLRVASVLPDFYTIQKGSVLYYITKDPIPTPDKIRNLVGKKSRTAKLLNNINKLTPELLEVSNQAYDNLYNQLSELYITYKARCSK